MVEHGACQRSVQLHDDLMERCEEEINRSHTFLCISSNARHVIVGRNFGSYVTHETKHFIYFYIGRLIIGI